MAEFSENTVNTNDNVAHVGVVIPCFRCEHTIKAVVEAIPGFVTTIVCTDDFSDDGTRGILAKLAKTEPRLEIVEHEFNRGVGGATVSGYIHALKLGADVIVKIDSDGQMDPGMIGSLIAPILEGEADYVKGNRFFDVDSVRSMPKIRLIGNAALSFLTKISTGYWDLFDPTNGFTAVHADVARVMPLERLHQRYFFESDMLFRLATIRAKVVEIPMQAIYGEERSNLSVRKTLLTFPWLHLRNCLKRIIYNYYLRGFSAGSISLLVGMALTGFGFLFGMHAWIESSGSGIAATSGTVMVSALPSILGVQFLLNFLNFDISSIPREPIHKRVQRFKTLKRAEPNDVIFEADHGNQRKVR